MLARGTIQYVKRMYEVEEVTDMMMGGWLLGLLLVLGTVLVLVLAGGGWLASRQGRSGSAPDPDTAARTPREILEARLARGEIDIEQYRAIVSEMNDGGAR